MEIEFGWCADGASWSDARAASAGRARLGPRGLVRLLQTRLGLAHPRVEPALRIAQCAVLLARTDHPWPRAAARLDPWATARHVLARRDELVAAGWDVARTPADAPPRVSAIAAIERSAREAGPGALAAGAADDLAEVHAMLARLDRDGSAWPLGISVLRCEEDPGSLPGRWPALLSTLGRLGVAVRGPEPAAERAHPGDLTIVAAPDEWAAAEAAARWLAERGDGAHVLATADTVVLDQELRRRAMPAIGIVGASADRSPQQVLGLFLSAAIAPVDVRQLAALLDLRLLDAAPRDATGATEGAAAGTGEPVGLVPASVRRRLLAALADEPGTGGPAWRAAIAAIEEEGTDVEREAARAVDELVSDPVPTGAAPPADLLARTDWLVRRLRAVDRGTGALAAPVAQVATFREVLSILPASPLGPRDLEQILGSCGGRAPSPLARPEAAPWSAVTSPAHLAPRGGPVLWWGCIEETPIRRTVWDDAETAALEAAGARSASPEELAALESDAALRGLAGAGHVVAVLPERRLGEAAVPHSLLAHLVRPGAGTVRDALARATVRAADLVADGRWSLAGAERALRRPAGTVPAPRASLTRRAQGGDHLLPERLSFSQVENLLGCHQKWTYRSALGIRPAAVATVATGNRMIGSLVHAVVQELVEERERTGAAPVPDPARIRGALDRLLPRHASELLLPGRETELARLRERVTRSLSALFARMAAAGLVVTGTEERFDRTLMLPLAVGPRDVKVTGFRDIDAEGPDGRATVIDLKWTVDRGRYARAYDEGEAVQLAMYAWSREPYGSAIVPAPPAAHVGYFLLEQGEFVASDPELDPSGREEPDVRDVLARTAAELTTALDEIASGTVTAVSGEVRREHALPIHPDRKSLESATAATKAAARDRGGLWIDAACGYCDFSLLCGLRGDHS